MEKIYRMYVVMKSWHQLNDTCTLSIITELRTQLIITAVCLPASAQKVIHGDNGSSWRFVTSDLLILDILNRGRMDCHAECICFAQNRERLYGYKVHNMTKILKTYGQLTQLTEFNPRHKTTLFVSPVWLVFHTSAIQKAPVSTCLIFQRIRSRFMRKQQKRFLWIGRQFFLVAERTFSSRTRELFKLFKLHATFSSNYDLSLRTLIS